MRRSLTIPILALLVLFALVAAALSSGHASASGDEPTILLDRIETDSQFESAVTEQPTSVHIGYGYIQPGIPSFSDVVFDEYNVSPLALTQTFVVHVDQDQDAVALAHDMSKVLPQYHGLGLVYWYEPIVGMHETRGFGSPDLVLHAPAGAVVEYFKMTVPPFTIEKKPQPPGAASQYGLVTDGSPVVIEAWGSPPAGDPNCDAAISSIDALIMLQHSAGLFATLPCAKAADVNADGTVDARDAALVLQFSAGLITAL